MNEEDVQVKDPEFRFVPSDPGCGLKQYIQEAIGAASTCWENFFKEGEVVNTGVFLQQYALAIADAVYERAMSPEGARMGMATTGQLLNELRVRLEHDSPSRAHMVGMIGQNLSPEQLAYRTVDS